MSPSIDTRLGSQVRARDDGDVVVIEVRPLGSGGWRMLARLDRAAARVLSSAVWVAADSAANASAVRDIRIELAG